MCHTFPDCRIYGLGMSDIACSPITAYNSGLTGFSLGGNILTKYAGEEGERCPFQALVTLANPWDFYAGHLHLPSTFLGRYLYRYVLGGALRRLLQLHRKAFLEAPKLPISRQTLEDLLHRPRITLGQWDTLWTAPVYGFKDAQDYYTRISSSRVAQDIAIPCLAINSWDDPIVGAESIPVRKVSHSIPSSVRSWPGSNGNYQVVQECPWVVLAVTRTGGHLGWYERDAAGRIARWYVKPVVQFLAALMEVSAYRPAGRSLGLTRWQYGLERRQKPRGVDHGAEFVRDPERPDVGFRELSQGHPDLVLSGVEESKLFTGW